MQDVLETLRSGGPGAYLILATFLLGLLGLPVLTGISLTKKRLFAPLWWLLPTLLILTALFSTTLGALEASEALPYATPDTRDLLAASGAALARQVGSFGLGLASILLSLSALGASLGPGLRPQGTTKKTLLLAAPTAVLSFFTLVGGIAWFFTHRAGFPLGSLGVIMGGLGLTLLAARFPTEEEGAAHTATSRVLVATLWIGAMICAAFAQSWWGEAQGFQALRSASPDFRISILQLTQRQSELALHCGLAMTLGTLLAVAAPTLATLRACFHKRALISAAVTMMLFFMMVGGALITGLMLGELHVDQEKLPPSNTQNENVQ